MVKCANIPVFILAGGLGTRISEETHLKPKPMIEVGDVPILVHLMRWYYSFGFNDFVICAGYRSWEIKNFFLTYQFRLNHMQIDHRTQADEVPRAVGQNNTQEQWRVRVIDTGQDTMTGARIARAFDLVTEEDTVQNFAVTYGDGVANVDLQAELAFHLNHQRMGTVLGVPPLARFGELDAAADGRVNGFMEKPQNKQGLINGGFFFFKADFRKYLSLDSACTLERTPLFKLAKDKQLMMYHHLGYWQCMDTLRDKVALQELWDSGKAPWLPTVQVIK